MHALIFLYSPQTDFTQRRNAAFEPLHLRLGCRHILGNRITLLRQLIAQLIVIA
ncbi:hypothetical protein D3C74_498880 [compost metagenome]